MPPAPPRRSRSTTSALRAELRAKVEELRASRKNLVDVGLKHGAASSATCTTAPSSGSCR